MVARNLSSTDRNLFFQTPKYQPKTFEVASKIATDRTLKYNLSDFIDKRSILRLVIKTGDNIERKSIFYTSSPNGQGKLSHLSSFEISKL